jgi:hypothetical protein
MDELLNWLPDGPAGWALVAVAVLAIAWWCVRRLPGRLFRYTVGRLARSRGWLVKSGSGATGAHGDLSGDGGTSPVSWEHDGLPGTHLELLGEHRGYLFHARQQRTRVKGATSFEHGGHSYRWRYDYVVSLAATNSPYDGFFTADARQTITDRRLALYPAFLEWERSVFPLFDSASYSAPEGFRRGHGLISLEKRNGRLSGGKLLNHLDTLVDAAARGR